MTRTILFLNMIVLGLGLLVFGCCDKNSGSSTATSSTPSSDWLQAEGKGDVLAEINGYKIYMDEFTERMEKQSPYIRARYNTLEKKKEFLDNMIRFELIVQQAQKQGYDKDPEVLRSAKQVMTQKLMRDELENKVKREDITDEELKKYYQEHQDQYNKPAMRRASHILIKVGEDATDKERKAALKKAKKLVKEAKAAKKDPNAFRKLAKKNSDDDANKNRGGDLGYFASTTDGGPLEKALSDAVFKMKQINDIAGPVKTKLGYHVLRLTGKRDAIQRDFEQVKGQIQHRLYKQRRTDMMDNFVAKLQKGAAININEQLLNQYSVPGAGPDDVPKNGISKENTRPRSKDEKNDSKPTEPK